MASELSDFSSSEIYSNQDFVDFLLNDFVTLKKFDDCLKVLFFFYLKVLFESTFESFYYVEKYEHDDCSQCFFKKNLRYIYNEHVLQEKNEVKELRNYCIMRKDQFITSRLFIDKLADLQKKKNRFRTPV